MARPPLPLGTYGRIRAYRRGDGWRARTLYRDWDGATRHVEKHGRTQGAAERALVETLLLRHSPWTSVAEDLRPRTVVAVGSKAQLHPTTKKTPADAGAFFINAHLVKRCGTLRRSRSPRRRHRSSSYAYASPWAARRSSFPVPASQSRKRRGGRTEYALGPSRRSPAPGGRLESTASPRASVRRQSVAGRSSAAGPIRSLAGPKRRRRREYHAGELR